jgi:hypothetical protein
MKSHVRVAVIGGGVVGCSVLDPGLLTEDIHCRPSAGPLLNRS